MNFKIRSFKPGDQATSYRYSWCQKRVPFWFKGGIQKGHNNIVYRNSNKMSLKAGADPGGGARGTQPPPPQVFLAQTEAWWAPPNFFLSLHPLPSLPYLKVWIDQCKVLYLWQWRTWTRLCSKENWRVPSALKQWNLGCPAYDLCEKSEIS